MTSLWPGVMKEKVHIASRYLQDSTSASCPYYSCRIRATECCKSQYPPRNSVALLTETPHLDSPQMFCFCSYLFLPTSVQLLPFSLLRGLILCLLAQSHHLSAAFLLHAPLATRLSFSSLRLMWCSSVSAAQQWPVPS